MTAPILLLEGVFEPGELVAAAQQDLWVTIDDERQLQWLEGASLARPLRCWLKLDTGMHRLGVTPGRAGEFYQRLQGLPQRARRYRPVHSLCLCRRTRLGTDPLPAGAVRHGLPGPGR